MLVKKIGLRLSPETLTKTLKSEVNSCLFEGHAREKKIGLMVILALSFLSVNSFLIAAGSLFPEKAGDFYIDIQTPADQETVSSIHFTLTFILRVPPAGFTHDLSYKIDNRQVSINPDSYTNAEENHSYTYGGYFPDYSNYTYSTTVDATGLSDGWHTLEVVVSGPVAYGPDPSQPLFQREVQKAGAASIRILLEASALKISILSPQPNQTYADSSVSLNFTLSESAIWIGYSLDGKPLATIDGNTTLNGLPEGMHNVTVYANDTSGNNYKSETVSFNVTRTTNVYGDESAPFPTAPVAVVSGASIVAAVAGATVYFKKRKRQRQISVQS